MALTLPMQTDETIELTDFIESVDKQVDRDEFDSLVDSAALLKKLANNRRFLADQVNERLLRSQQNDEGAGGTSLLLGQRNRLWVRANVWIPPADLPMNVPLRANVAAYLIPHDHRFSFATVGYLGSGYETTIFEYDRSSVVGRPGEQVQLQFLEKTQLTEGKVMVYRAGKDVHCQAHPRDFSISLNLIVFAKEYHDQYTFDVKHSRISGRAQDFRRGQSMMCDMAAALGNGRTSNVLEEVALRHSDEEVRLSAFAAWSRLDSDRAKDIWQKALSDHHPLVRDRALTALTELA